MRKVSACFAGVSLLLLVACGNAVDEEAKRLGFSSKYEMEEVHSKGWHTNAQYRADETARAERLGFINMDELHAAEESGILDPKAYREFKAKEDAKSEAEEAARERDEKDSEVQENKSGRDATTDSGAEISENDGPGFFSNLMGSVGLNQAKNIITSSCRNLKSATGDTSMFQMQQVFGDAKVSEWCECTYNTMARKYSNKALEAAPDAGALDETATAIKKDVYMVTASCIERSNVPPKGKGLAKDFAAILRSSVAMSEALR